LFGEERNTQVEFVGEGTYYFEEGTCYSEEASYYFEEASYYSEEASYSFEGRYNSGSEADSYVVQAPYLNTG
jgi:hypothetical protein